MPAPSSQIHCNGSGGLHFVAVHGLFIGNLMFSTCGTVLPWPFNGKFRAALAIGLKTPQKSIFDVTITRVVIQNSTGHGLYASNVPGKSVISESTFIYNNYNGSQEYYGGHIRMSYENCLENAGNSTFTIQSSYLLWGVICVKFNMHNISNMSIAFIELTMPTCMHNMSMFMHNMPMFMHNMPMFMHNMSVFMHNMSVLMHNVNVHAQPANVYAQHANVHAQHANVHAQHVNVHAQHVSVHAQHANIHAQYANIHAQYAIM